MQYRNSHESARMFILNNWNILYLERVLTGVASFDDKTHCSQFTLKSGFPVFHFSHLTNRLILTIDFTLGKGMFLIICGQRKSYSLTSKRKSKVGGPFKESDSIFFIKKIFLEKPKNC